MMRRPYMQLVDQGIMPRKPILISFYFAANVYVLTT